MLVAKNNSSSASSSQKIATSFGGKLRDIKGGDGKDKGGQRREGGSIEGITSDKSENMRAEVSKGQEQEKREAGRIKGMIKSANPLKREKPADEMSEEELRKARLEQQRRKETQAMAKIGVAAGAAYLTGDKSHLKDIKPQDVKMAAKGAFRQATTINPIKKFGQQRQFKKAVKKEAKKLVKKVAKKILKKVLIALLPFILLLLLALMVFLALMYYVCEGQDLGSAALRVLGFGKLCQFQ